MYYMCIFYYYYYCDSRKIPQFEQFVCITTEHLWSKSSQFSLNYMHYFTCIFYILCHIINTFMNRALKRKWKIIFWSCAEKSNWTASSFRSHLISFWSPQLWVLLSQLQNGIQRLKDQKPSCLSDAAYCNTGHLRWILRLQRSWKKRLALFFSTHIFIS